MEAKAQRCELTCLRSHSLGRREPECLRNLGGELQMQSGFELGSSEITVGTSRLQGGIWLWVQLSGQEEVDIGGNAAGKTG